MIEERQHHSRAAQPALHRRCGSFDSAKARTQIVEPRCRQQFTLCADQDGILRVDQHQVVALDITKREPGKFFGCGENICNRVGMHESHHTQRVALGVDSHFGIHLPVQMDRDRGNLRYRVGRRHE